MRLRLAVVALMMTACAGAQITMSGGGTISGSAAASTQGGQAATVYASPTGNDANDCSIDHPCLSPQRVSAVLQTKPAGQKVAMFHGGFYPATVWTLGASDSGTQANPVLYMAYPGETPVISGGRRIAGTWTQGSQRCGGLCQEWDITLDANPSDTGYFVKFESLFYNGMRRYRPSVGVETSGWSVQSGMKCVATASAACPIQGNCAAGQYQCHDRYLRDAKDNTLSSFHGVTGSCTSPGSCSGMHEVEILGMENWTGALMRLTSSSNDGTNACTTSASTYCSTGITSAAPNFGPKTNHHYLRVNALEDFNQPGQFYLDVCPATNCSGGQQENVFVLRYLASQGENPNTDEVIAPQVSKILSATNLQYVTFNGLTFEHDNYVVPAAGQPGTSFASNVAAALSFQGSSNVWLDRSAWAHMGSWAVEFKGTASAGQGNRITNFVCTDAGVGCVRLGVPPNGGDSDANVAQYNVVSNGILTGGMRVIPMGPGNAVSVGNAHHNIASHLLIDDWYNAPTEIGESQGYDTTSLAHDNVFTENVISNFGQGVTSDMGGIHIASGAAAGNIFSYNVVHDATQDTDSPGYNGECIYVDNSSSYVSIIGNLTYRCSEASLLLNSNTDAAGRGNVVVGNILAGGKQGAIKQTTSNTYLDLTATNNILMMDQGNVHGGPQFAHDPANPGVQWYCQGTSCPSIFKFDYNNYWNTGMDLGSGSQTPWYTTNASGAATWMNWNSWKALAEDTHSAIGDPGFVGASFAQGDDYSFIGAAPVGFNAWDTEQAGPSGLAMPGPVPAAYPLSLWPSLAGSSPSSGVVGTVVAITGKSFQPGATVTFGGTNASSVTFTDSAHLSAVVPSVTGTVNIVVTNANGKSDTLVNAFTVLTNGSYGIILPQAQVNSLEYASDLASPAVTKNIKSDGSGDYPWTCGGIQSAINAWAAAADQAWLVKIDPGTLPTVNGQCFQLTPKVAGPPSHFIILESSNPLTRGVLPCGGGLGTAISGTVRNNGCASGTSLSHMWYVQSSAINSNVISTADSSSNPLTDASGHGPSHFVLLDFQASPTTSVTTTNAPLRIGVGSETTVAMLPSHIHAAYFYIHGDASDTFTSGSNPGDNIMSNDATFNCAYCSMGWFYMDKTTRPGSEGHGIAIANAVGPLKITNFFIEGSSSGIFHGGQTPSIPGILASSDEEIRVGTLTYPVAWIGASWAASPSRKNALEIKEGQRILIDGVTFEYVDNTGGQLGPCIGIDTRSCSAGQACDNYAAVIHDVTVSNNIFRHCLGLQLDARSGGPSAGVSVGYGSYNFAFINNLFYDGDGAAYCKGGGGCTPYRWPGMSSETSHWGGSGDSSTCSATRTASGNVTLTCTDGGTGLHQTDILVGDPVLVQNCTDDTFNNPSLSVAGPPALAGTVPTGRVVVYNNGATGAASTSGCTLYNQQGYWQNFIWSHNTVAVSSGSSGSTFGPNIGSCPITSTGAAYMRNVTFQNNLWALDGWGGFSGNGAAEGSSGAKPAMSCLDLPTLTFDHNIIAERNASNYTDYLNGAVQASKPLYFPTTPQCASATPTASCIGFAGMLSGTFVQNPSDYHAFELCGGSGSPAGCNSASFYAGGQANDASDGTDMGANIPAIDSAQQLNQYPGFYPSH